MTRGRKIVLLIKKIKISLGGHEMEEKISNPNNQSISNNSGQKNPPLTQLTVIFIDKSRINIKGFKFEIDFKSKTKVIPSPPPSCRSLAGRRLAGLAQAPRPPAGAAKAGGCCACRTRAHIEGKSEIERERDRERMDFVKINSGFNLRFIWIWEFWRMRGEKGFRL